MRNHDDDDDVGGGDDDAAIMKMMKLLYIVCVNPCYSLVLILLPKQQSKSPSALQLDSARLGSCAT